MPNETAVMLKAHASSNSLRSWTWGEGCTASKVSAPLRICGNRGSLVVHRQLVRRSAIFRLELLVQ